MTEATRDMLATAAGSLIVLVAFVLLVAASAALFMVWRGLLRARAEVGPLALRARELARETEDTTAGAAHAVLGPQIRAASAWAGLKAAARALARSRAPTPRPAERPPI